jgi:formate hydrogenlyase transcriptional activator
MKIIGAMSESAEAASDAVDQQRLFQSICDLLVRTGSFQLAWFGYADESARKIVEPIAYAGDQEGFLHDLQIALGQTDYEDPSSIVIRTGEVCWIKDLRDHPGLAPIRSAVLQRGYTSVLSIPVMWDGWPPGALTLYYGDPDRFGEAAVRILKEQLGLTQAVFTRRARLPRPRPEEQEAELREVLDVIPQHVTLITPSMRMLYVNRAELEYHGHALEDILSGASVAKIIHPDDLERVAVEFTTKFSTGAAFEHEVRLRRKDGQYRWFLYQVTPLRDEQGHIVRWCCTGIDIEDRKQAEERIRKENLQLREEIDRALMFEEIVGNSERLRAVLTHVVKVAATDSTVIVMGETGTGKELIARAIHRRSPRSRRAFIAVNCAAIPTSLIASELFGHEKGSFTGATQQRLGRFELADGGTIFLDEVGELPPETQVALLRLLQEREVERIGGKGPISVDVRVIAATNRDLSAAVADGTFRQDLFYRLSVFPIDVPSLRERAEDIPMLVEYFMGRYASKMSKRIKNIEPGTLKLFQRYAWPGNVRELQNIVERGVILSEGDTFCVNEAWLQRELPRSCQQVSSLKTSLMDWEKKMVEAALKESRGRVSGPSGAAVKLGLPPPTLESKIRSLQINKHRFKVA